MNSKQKYKSKEKIIFMTLKIMIFIILSYMAIKIGTLGGAFLSDVDSGLIKGIDVSNFKAALNNTFPIIDTIYNSGNISLTFSGEVKSLIKYIFDFDLNNPVTILNAQSPYIYSYYMNDYQKILAERDNKNNMGDAEEETENQENEKGGLLQDQSSIYLEEDKGEDKSENKTPENNIVSKGKIIIDNETKTKINIEELLKQPLKINLDKKGPKVLIYHTHTTESYISTLSDLNKSSVSTRTKDPRNSVVRVGEELANILRKQYGIEVIHNGTIHDYPLYNGAYGRSLNTASQILKSYPSIKVVLDIHRDAIGTDGNKLRAVKNINKKNAAQVMLVVGSNASGLNHPNWMENLKFAVKLQERLNEISPGLMKPIDLSKNRYNQQVTNDALIIEIGGDGNLLSECLESTKYVAQAINDVVNKK